MISPKVSSLFLIPALIMSLAFSFLLINPTNVAAQDQTSSKIVDFQCPLDGYVEMELLSFGQSFNIEDLIEGTIYLHNPSSYTMPGFRVGVVVYDQKEVDRPAYWSVLPDSYQVNTLSSVQVPFSFNATALPSGDYVVRLVAFQGDDINLLGSAMRPNRDNQNEFFISKASSQTSLIETEIILNEQIINSERSIKNEGQFKIEVITTNKNNKNLEKSNLTVAIAKGEIPLGSAVSSAKNDSFFLLPGTSRTTKLVDNFINNDEYTIYVILSTTGKLQPIISRKVDVGSTKGSFGWPYISQVAVESVPLAKESGVITCINYIGDYQNLLSVVGTVGVEASLIKTDNTIYTERKANLNGQKEMFFKFYPSLNLNNFDLEVSLLENKFNYNLKDEVEPLEVLVRSQSISGNLICDEGEECSDAGKDVVLESYQDDQKYGEGFMFYVGVTIAALLLMYLMLRRLPSERYPGVEDDLSGGELN